MGRLLDLRFPLVCACTASPRRLRYGLSPPGDVAGPIGHSPGVSQVCRLSLPCGSRGGRRAVA